MFIIMRGMCYYINLEGKSIMAYLDCPAEIECVIWDCIHGVEKTAVTWRLEKCDKVDKYLKTSPVHWLNFNVRL